ncbi:hypothetical protein SAMN04489712_106331 [Thermomonospora echinospora]|uniref:Uncharacterized protein n=1 Tax=Thermomonospora echinospora TaxID=1992 RepID=A0A1H6B7B9_9ACTN|nr:hypothetical protein SAMN04489712_106331 [Thermomonospora echinospora]
MFRSVGNPIFLGLGTAAILAMGASAPVQAETAPSPGAQPSPSVSAPFPSVPDDSGSPSSPDGSGSPDSPEEPTPTPDPWEMAVDITVPKGKVFEGDEVTVTVEVKAEKVTRGTRLTLAAKGRPAPALSKCATTPCKLGKVDWRGRKLDVKLTIPKEMKSGSVRLTAAVSGEGAEDASLEKTIEVHKKLDPKPSPSPSKSGGGSGSGGSGGSGGSSGSGGDTTYTPPAPNGSFNGSSAVPSPQVDLPQVSPPSPELAGPGPSAQAFPQSALRSNDSPADQQLRFERLASTQAAWLAALLVAFSLLLTQLRLGRRPAAGAAATRRPKGAHRRPRRGKSRG